MDGFRETIKMVKTTKLNFLPFRIVIITIYEYQNNTTGKIIAEIFIFRRKNNFKRS